MSNFPQVLYKDSWSGTSTPNKKRFHNTHHNWAKKKGGGGNETTCGSWKLNPFLTYFAVFFTDNLLFWGRKVDVLVWARPKAAIDGMRWYSILNNAPAVDGVLNLFLPLPVLRMTNSLGTEPWRSVPLYLRTSFRPPISKTLKISPRPCHFLRHRWLRKVWPSTGTSVVVMAGVVI